MGYYIAIRHKKQTKEKQMSKLTLKGNETETYYQNNNGHWFIIGSSDPYLNDVCLPSHVDEKDLPEDLEDVSIFCLDQSHFEHIDYCQNWLPESELYTV